MAKKLAKLTHRHKAIADWLLSHPEGTLSQCAKEVGFSPVWTSIVVNSDTFKAYYDKRVQGAFDARTIPLRDKVVNAANRAMDKLVEKVESVDDVRLMLDIAEKMLGRLGYGVGEQKYTQNNSLTVVGSVTPSEIEQARQRYRDLQRSLTSLPQNGSEPLVHVEPRGVPDPEPVQLDKAVGE